MYQSRGEYSKALDFFVRALEDSRKQGNHETVVSSLRSIAQLHRLRNEYKEAIALYKEIREYYVTYGEEKVGALADDLYNLAQLYRLRNQSKNAIELYSEDPEIKEEERIVKLLCMLARLHRLRDEYDEAITLYLKVATIHADLSDRKVVLTLYVVLLKCIGFRADTKKPFRFTPKP